MGRKPEDKASFCYFGTGGEKKKHRWIVERREALAFVYFVRDARLSPRDPPFLLSFVVVVVVIGSKAEGEREIPIILFWFHVLFILLLLIRV